MKAVLEQARKGRRPPPRHGHRGSRPQLPTAHQVPDRRHPCPVPRHPAPAAYPQPARIQKVNGEKMIPPVIFHDKNDDPVHLEAYSDDHHGFLRVEGHARVVHGPLLPSPPTTRAVQQGQPTRRLLRIRLENQAIPTQHPRTDPPPLTARRSLAADQSRARPKTVPAPTSKPRSPPPFNVDPARTTMRPAVSHHPRRGRVDPTQTRTPSDSGRAKFRRQPRNFVAFDSPARRHSSV